MKLTLEVRDFGNLHANRRLRRELDRRLAERDIDVPTNAWDWVTQQFTYEVQRYVFGRSSENERRLSDDRQVQKALELLGASQSVDELFAAVQRISGEEQGIE